MKKKLKLKSYVLPSLYVCLFIATFYITLVVSNSLTKKAVVKAPENENLDYVTDTILDKEEEDKPVIKEETKMIKPYTNDKVTIGKYFYNQTDENTKQENSITYHDNTYIQNSGIDYILEESFDVVSILDGTVAEVKTDDILGKIVEIKHDNDYISVYQSLSTIDVKKGDTIKQGQVIGKSGTNEMDKDMGNHLHFELYIKNQVVDPTQYIDKAITENKQEQTDTKEENKTETKTEE